MHQQANGNDSRFWEQQQDYINHNGPLGMQGMKTNTATASLVNWMCQQVIYIYQHRR